MRSLRTVPGKRYRLLLAMQDAARGSRPQRNSVLLRLQWSQTQQMVAALPSAPAARPERARRDVRHTEGTSCRARYSCHLVY